MKSDVTKKIEQLKNAAKKQGLKITFRDRPTNLGDFCIFIYDRSYRINQYAVGYDGMWNAEESSPLHFLNCLKYAYNWLENRDERFSKINGRWTVKDR